MNLADRERAKELIANPDPDQELIIQYFTEEQAQLKEALNDAAEWGSNYTCEECEDMSGEIRELECQIEDLEEKLEVAKKEAKS